MAISLIDPDQVEAAGVNLRTTAGDVQQAGTESATNAKNVVGTAEEIKASKATVEGFIQALGEKVKDANRRVVETEWQSASRDRFESAVVDITERLATIGQRYTEEYDKAVLAVDELQTAVTDLDRDFDRVIADASPLLEDYGQTAINHAQEQRRLADQGIV